MILPYVTRNSKHKAQPKISICKIKGIIPDSRPHTALDLSSTT